MAEQNPFYIIAYGSTFFSMDPLTNKVLNKKQDFNIDIKPKILSKKQNIEIIPCGISKIAYSHGKIVTCVCYAVVEQLHANSRRTYYAHYLKVWDSDTFDLLWELDLETTTSILVFSPDVKKLLTSDNKSVNIWDMESKQIEKTIKCRKSTVTKLIFLKGINSDKIVIGHQNGFITIWDYAKKEMVASIKFHITSIRELTCTNDGNKIISLSRNTYVTDVSVLLQIGIDKYGPISNYRFAQNKYMMTDAEMIRLKQSLADSKSIQLFYENRHQDPLCMTNITVRPDNQRIISLGRDGMHEWDISTGHFISAIGDASRYLSNVSFLEDNKIICHGPDLSVDIWDVDTNDLVGPRFSYKNIISGEVIDRTTEPLFVLAMPNEFERYNKQEINYNFVTITKTQPEKNASSDSRIDSFGKEKKEIGIVVADRNNYSMDLDLNLGQANTITNVHKEDDYKVDKIAYSHNKIATFGGNFCLKINCQTVSLYKSQTEFLVFSPDGGYLLLSQGNDVHVLDTQTRLEYVLKCASPVKHLFFLKESEPVKIIMGHDNGKITIWNFNNKELVATINNHNAQITAMICTNDGTKIISADINGNAYIIDIRSHNIDRRIKNSGKIKSLSITSDDTKIVTSEHDMRLYDTATGLLIKRIGPCEHYGGDVMFLPGDDNKIIYQDNQFFNILNTETNMVIRRDDYSLSPPAAYVFMV